MNLLILNIEQVFESEKEQFITKSVLIGRSFDNLRNITIKSSFFSDIKEMNLMVKFAQIIDADLGFLKPVFMYFSQALSHRDIVYIIVR